MNLEKLDGRDGRDLAERDEAGAYVLHSRVLEAHARMLGTKRDMAPSIDVRADALAELELVLAELERRGVEDRERQERDEQELEPRAVRASLRAVHEAAE